MRRFADDEGGVVAVIFAVMAVPFIALGGWAVDYIRLQHVQNHLQAQADTAALNAVVGREVMQGTNCLEVNSEWEPAMRAEIEREYQGIWARELNIVGRCLNASEFQVSADANVPLSFMKIIPGIDDTQRVAVSATVQLNRIYWDYSIQVADLDYDAGDYNRVWAYCYWPNRPENDPDLPNRTQMVPIADNGGPNVSQRNVYEQDEGEEGYFGNQLSIIDAQLRAEYESILINYMYGLDGRERGLWRQTAGGSSNWREYLYVAPRCSGDSALSFRLENVRFSRTQPRFWEDENNEGMDWDNHSRVQFAPSGFRHRGRFNYYTDTYSDANEPGEQYAGLTLPDVGNQYVQPGEPAHVLETVLCQTEDECRPVSEGGIIPEGTNRTPERASEACSPGKFMYYGWEDRPPGLSGPANDWQDIAWTDADYDDIRVIIECPEPKPYGDRNARLVR